MSGEDEVEFKGCEHRWSLLKDEEFTKDYINIIDYFAAAHRSSPCTHTEAPITLATHAVANAFLEMAPFHLPGPVQDVMQDVIQRVGIEAFFAGIQFSRDGEKTDGFREFEADTLTQDEEISEKIKTMGESRKNFRAIHYAPDEPEDLDMDQSLGDFIKAQKEKGVRVKILDDGSTPIPAQLRKLLEGEGSEEGSPVGWGGYL